jgi:hypothetical protein
MNTDNINKKQKIENNNFNPKSAGKRPQASIKISINKFKSYLIPGSNTLVKAEEFMNEKPFNCFPHFTREITNLGTRSLKHSPVQRLPEKETNSVQESKNNMENQIKKKKITEEKKMERQLENNIMQATLQPISNNLVFPSFKKFAGNFNTLRSFGRIQVPTNNIELNSINLSESSQENNWHHMRRRFSRNSSFTERYLPQLKRLLLTIFNYQDVSLEDLDALNAGERAIFKILILAKDYSPKEKLVENLYLKNFDFDVWRRFSRVKRKEENLKYGLKLIFKYLQERFYETNTAKILKNNFRHHETCLLFYLHYFGHLEFEVGYEKLIEMINNHLIPIHKVWSLLGKYVLPEMGEQSLYSSAKSINKNFLKDICGSQKFVKEAMRLLLDSILNWGYCRTEKIESLKHLNESQKNIGNHFLMKISKTNVKEINRLFKEWENQIIAKDTYINTESPKAINNSLELVKKNAKRKNLKFPWTFQEVKVSFIECFLTLLEFSDSFDSTGKH